MSSSIQKIRRIKRGKPPRLNIEITSKFWEREYSIFTMSSWRFSLDIINKKQYGNNALTIFVCTYQKGLATHFRSRDEEDKLERIIGKKFIQSSAFRKKIINLHNYFAKKLLDLYKQINKIDKISSNLVKNFNVSAGKFFAYNTFIQRSIDYVEGIDVSKKIITLLIKQRTKYEKEVVGKYELYLNKICKKVAEEKNIASSDLLKLLTVEEFIDFIKTDKLPPDLKERNKLSVLILLPQTILLTGKPASLLFRRLKQQNEKVNRQLLKEVSIKGIPVYPGRIRGVIQVIINLRKLKEFRPGNILVAPTTLPKYSYIIKRARGIITDEGGLLSHGAVLSREFKIPAVVGTKIATRKLKTGQVVEMDASSGVIKVIR